MTTRCSVAMVAASKVLGDVTDTSTVTMVPTRLTAVLSTLSSSLSITSQTG